MLRAVAGRDQQPVGDGVAHLHVLQTAMGSDDVLVVDRHHAFHHRGVSVTGSEALELAGVMVRPFVTDVVSSVDCVV